MKYKDGVIIRIEKMISGKPEIIEMSVPIIKALNIADTLSVKHFGQEIVITSLLDSVHSKKSLHYGGNACDLRSYIYTEDQVQEFVYLMREVLGKDYDIIFERNPDHIHIEYDPK